MTIGNGIAIAGIWLGLGLVSFSGIPGIAVFGIAVCAMLATLFTKS